MLYKNIGERTLVFKLRDELVFVEPGGEIELTAKEYKAIKPQFTTLDLESVLVKASEAAVFGNVAEADTAEMAEAFIDSETPVEVE